MSPTAYVVSATSSNDEPVPVDQVEPASKLYSQDAMSEAGVTSIVRSLVILSVELVPESLCSAKSGAAGATVSMVNVAVAADAVCAFPAASVCVAETATAPSPSLSTSLDVSATACAVPSPVTDLVTVPDWPVRVTTIAAPLSPLTVITPPVAAASASVAPFATPDPSATTGAAGAIVSIVKVVVAAAAVCAFPAASVCVADTATAPSPRVSTSLDVSAMACAVPSPVTDLVTVPDWPVSVTTIAEPFSPLTVMTPPDAAASASVAPSLTPDPSANTGAVGAIVSTVNVAVFGVASCGLPAASVCATDTVTDPSPSVSTSSAVNETATAEPVPVTVFTTAPD